MTAEPDLEDRLLEQLYQDFGTAHLNPLWTQLGSLMPMAPTTKAVPFVWKWSTLYPLAQRAGDLVPVGRGGDRRAIALANPGLGGVPYATSTLWAAIQYLGPKETAPEHRHSQNAFRFVVAGEGVWTVVNGDPVAMRRGDFLLTPGWHFHGHHNETNEPMAWIDGLDIPFVHYTDTRLLRIRVRFRDRRRHPGCVTLGTVVGASGPAPAGRARRQDQLPDRRLPLGAHRCRAT
jgi:gentisate 1,2-dioxygenase